MHSKVLAAKWLPLCLNLYLLNEVLPICALVVKVLWCQSYYLGNNPRSDDNLYIVAFW